MSLPNRSTKLKVASGYILLTALLFASIGYIFQEMQSLTGTGDDEAILSRRRHFTNRIIGQLYQAEVIGQSLSTGQLGQYRQYKTAMEQANIALDSLRNLLTDSVQMARLDTVSILFMEKERNMRNLLRAIQQGGTDKIYKQHIDELIAEQDSLLSLPHVKRKVITHTNSYVIRKKPKSFIKRLGEVFAPGKGDSTQVNNVIQEEYTDTLTEAYSPADTVVTMLKDIQSRVTDTHQERMEMVNRRTQSLRLSGLKVSQKVNQLLSAIEEEEQALAQNKYMQEEHIRQKSIRTVAGIAIAAVVLAVLFLVLIWRDITRSNHYRRELEKAKRRAEDLLVAREKLMLTITHDIKAPVGSILGYTDLLERITTEERQRFYLDNMQSSANHLLSLVNSLLDYHRLDAHKMDINRVSFNPRQLFDTIYISFKPIATAKKLKLNYECGEALNRVYTGDPFRIRQILENLLSNALKFTKQGSITLRAALENGQLHFSVCDTGCGISTEEQKRIFQEFTRLHNAQGQEGFGLGLAITHKLVLLLGGEIRIDSEPGKGSCFHVYLPLDDAPHIQDAGNTYQSASTRDGKEDENGTVDSHKTLNENRVIDESGIVDLNGQKTSPTSGETANTGETIRLILIDDDRIQLQLTTAMLERPGVAVTCCEQPEELFNKLKESHFDALLTDIQMPAMNGFDLLKAVRMLNAPQAHGLPIIAITARSDMDETYFRSQGFAGCLHKPFTTHELLTTVSQVTSKPIPAIEADPYKYPNASTHSSFGPSGGGHNSPSRQVSLNFSALTAFSEDDAEAATEIIRTFISETEKNRIRMEKALEEKDPAGITAMAHKLLPLFTMLGAERCIPSLKWLEEKRGTAGMTDEMADKTNFVLKEIQEVIREAEQHI